MPTTGAWFVTRCDLALEAMRDTERFTVADGCRPVASDWGIPTSKRGPSRSCVDGSASFGYSVFREVRERLWVDWNRWRVRAIGVVLPVSFVEATLHFMVVPANSRCERPTALVLTGVKEATFPDITVGFD